MSRSKVSLFAKVDPAHLLDGLFTPTTRKGEALYDVQGEFDGISISFKGVQMSATHQSLLLAISARTARENKNAVLVSGNESDLHGKTIKALEMTGKAINKDVSVVKCSAYALLADAGMTDAGNNYKDMVEKLHEMPTVTMYRGNGLNGGSSRLLSFDHDGEQFIVRLNWRMADAILGKQNIQISLHERNWLKDSAVAKILHAWLSGHIRLGGQLMAGRGAEIDTLIKHVWGKKPASEDVMKKRRYRVRQALEEINKIDGWVCIIKGSHTYISRPKELTWGDKNDMQPGDLAELEKTIIEDLLSLQS